MPSSPTQFLLFKKLTRYIWFNLAGIFIFSFFTPAMVAWSYTPEEFVILIKTDNVGTSGSNQFRIPTVGTGYNYDVDWDNDGTYESMGVTGSITHAYSVAGTYTAVSEARFLEFILTIPGMHLRFLRSYNGAREFGPVWHLLSMVAATWLAQPMMSRI